MTASGWKTLPWLITLALAVGSAAGATADDSLAVDKACASVADNAATTADLDALRQRIVAQQTATTGAGLEEACQGWRHLARNPGSASLLRTEWQAQVAASLVWLGRSAEAEPLLDSAYARYAEAGTAHIDKRAQIAGMLMVISLQRGQIDAALQWSQRAVDAVGHPASTASVSERLRLQLNHGALLSRARRYDEAQALLLGLLDEALTQPDSLAAEAAAGLNALSNLARRQSRLEEALGYTEREIALRQARVTQDPVNLANAMQNRGLLLMSLARYDAAEAALEAALQQARGAQAAGAVDLWGHQTAVRETLSGLLLARGRPADALKVADDAIASLAGRPEAGTARGARPLRRQAEAQLALGELGQGVATYRRALALLGTTVGAPEADNALALRFGHALAMIELGELDEAAASLQQVLTDTRPRNPEETARLRVLQATLALRRGDGAAASQHWLEADQALAAALPPGHPDRRFVQTQACELQAAPCPPATDAASTPDADALMQMSLARRARAAHDAAGADAAARLAVAAANASGQPRLQWQALALWADVLADAGRRGQAVFVGKLALTQLQQQRQRLLPLGTVADARYLADKAPLYRRVADWLLQAQRIPEALEVMRLLKVQEQADFAERGVAESAHGVGLNTAEQAAWRRLEAALQAGTGAKELHTLGERAAAQRITAEESVRLAQLRRDEAARRDGRVAGLTASLAGLDTASPAAGTRGTPSSLRRPPPGQLHAHLLAGEQRLSLLLVSATGTRLHQLDLPAAELARQVAALRDALATPAAASTVQPLAESLYQRVGRFIDTAARQSRAAQVTVWLDGPLRYLPPGLMHDGQQPLAARYRWIVAGGLAAPASAAPPSRLPALRIAAFGVTQAFQGLPALPAVADELCDIVAGPVLGLDDSSKRCGVGARGQGPVPGQGRLNALFTEAALARTAAGAPPGELLHISTHFVLRPGSIAKSWLLLGDGSRLPLERLRRMDMGTPRLVTLSACETAVTDATAGDGREVDGLAVTLLDRGASQVLASLWRVDDRATARFMQRFYTAYASQPGQAAAALQRAQRQAMAEGAPARDWAAFVLLGQGGAGS